MSFTNLPDLKRFLAEGEQLSGQQLATAVQVLITELETARRKNADLEARVRSLEARIK